MTATASARALLPYRLTRVGVLMTPEPDNPFEAEGVLNPAAARDRSGRLRLFPRLVAAGNFSRIGDAAITVVDGIPTGVERLGVVLAPDRAWERGAGHGGTEDPRITWIPRLGVHVMTYVAYGPIGPRPAIAISDGDLTSWRRIGPIQFGYDDELSVDLNLVPNKDVVFFPEPVPGPDGEPSYAALHRPMWGEGVGRPVEGAALPTGTTDPRPSIWISYVRVADLAGDPAKLVRLAEHRFVAGPAFDWEAAKIGAGTVPVRVDNGWLVIHHGVVGELTDNVFDPQPNVRYCAGALLLAAEDPAVVLARTSEPLLEPATAEETDGAVGNVVFPTALERIDGTDYVFYGMADSRIGVARLDRTDGAAE